MIYEMYNITFEMNIYELFASNIIFIIFINKTNK